MYIFLTTAAKSFHLHVALKSFVALSWQSIATQRLSEANKDTSAQSNATFDHFVNSFWLFSFFTYCFFFSLSFFWETRDDLFKPSHKHRFCTAFFNYALCAHLEIKYNIYIIFKAISES